MKINVKAVQVYRTVKNILIGETFQYNSNFFLVTRHFAENGIGIRCYIDLATGYQTQFNDDTQVLSIKLQVTGVIE